MAKKDIRAIYNTCASLTKMIEEKSENGKKEVDKSLLDSLSKAFNEILEFERLYLIKCQDRFFGILLMDIEFEINYNQKGPVDLRVDKNPFALVVNPLWCNGLTFSEFTGLIIQELTRMLYLHPTAFAKTNSSRDPETHELLERASDAASSSVVRRDIKLVCEDTSASSQCRLPKDSYTTSVLREECGVRANDDMPLEYYYEVLKKYRKKDPKQPSMPGSQPPVGIVNYEGNPSQAPVSTKGSDSGTQVHNWEEQSSDDTEDTIKSMVETAYNNTPEQNRGYMAGSIVSQIKTLLAPPEINWKQCLSKMVGAVPVPYRKTKMRLNRRQPYRADLSGKLPKRTVDIVCCFDTSGSMSDSDLAYCINEVFNIIKVYEGYKVTIVECDYEVQRVYKARNMGDIKQKMKGRGGTAFTPAIEYINGTGKFANNKEFPDAGKYRNALMVYFTDGYGEYKIPRPKTYRNLWVVLRGTDNLSVSEPYGDVKSLSMDKDYKKMKGYN